jgi:tripartite-type tricarboxylate transporter receptor subunit TctC
MVGFTPLVLVVNPKLPVKSVGEFIDYVKDSKEPVPYGSAGSPAEFRAELEADLSCWRGVTRKAGIALD